MARVFFMSLTDERMLVYNWSSSAKGASVFEGRSPRITSRLAVGRRHVEAMYFMMVEANINCPDDLWTRHLMVSGEGHEGLMREARGCVCLISLNLSSKKCLISSSGKKLLSSARRARVGLIAREWNSDVRCTSGLLAMRNFKGNWEAERVFEMT